MGRLRHLVARFFEVLAARPLTPAEQQEAGRMLCPRDAPVFWGQAGADQRHALSAARRVAAGFPERPELIRAALLHDVGKRHTRLGIAGRVIASLVEMVGLPGPGRLGRYLAHGAIGAADLEAAGCEPIVVAFARRHHGERPVEITVDDWAILTEADGEQRRR